MVNGLVLFERFIVAINKPYAFFNFSHKNKRAGLPAQTRFRRNTNRRQSVREFRESAREREKRTIALKGRRPHTLTPCRRRLCVAGCISEMWINHKLVDFSNAAKMNGVTPGCGTDDEEADEANKATDVTDNMQVDNADQVVPQQQQQQHVHEHSGTPYTVLYFRKFVCFGKGDEKRHFTCSDISSRYIRFNNLLYYVYGQSERKSFVFRRRAPFICCIMIMYI